MAERNGSGDRERELAGEAVSQPVNGDHRSAESADSHSQQQPHVSDPPPLVYGPAWLPHSVYRQSVPLADDDKVWCNGWMGEVGGGVGEGGL